MKKKTQKKMVPADLTGKVVGTNGKPWVLISGPVTAYKLSVISEFIRHVKNLTYPNFAVLLPDNSESDDMYQSLKPVEREFAKNGILFYTVMTPHRPFIRSRLVEGENLAYDVIFKREDLSPYQLSTEDEKKVRELQKIDFEYLFGLEQDVLPPPDVLERLIEDDKDAISGVYFNSKVYADPNTGAQSQQFIPMIWSWGNASVKEAEILVDTNIEYLTPSRVDQTAATGIGCILIKKDTLAHMISEFDFKPRYLEAILRYKNDPTVNKNLNDLNNKLVSMANALVQEQLINTMSGQNKIEVEEVEVEINGEKAKIKLPIKFHSWGFRYQQGKYACFAEGTSIQTKRGFVPIEEVTTEDECLTHLGNWEKVEIAGHQTREYIGNMVTIIPYGDCEGIIVTEDHYIFRHNEENLIEETEAKNIMVGDTLRRPIDMTETDILLPYTIEQKEKFWELMGFYLAEGCYSSRDISFGLKDISTGLLEKYKSWLDEFGQEYNEQENKSTTRLFLSRRGPIVKMVDRYLKGQRSWEKRIPFDWLQLPMDCQKALLIGYWRGDGNLITLQGEHGKGRDYRISSTSRELLVGIREICYRLGLLASIRGTKPGGIQYIEGREVLAKDSWDIRLGAKFGEWVTPEYVKNPRENSRNRIVDENGKRFLYLKVKEIRTEEVDGIPVFDLTVQNEHGVTTPLFSAHNCSDMYMSLDINRGGKTLWFDSRVWCKHLHQIWDTQTMGER